MYLARLRLCISSSVAEALSLSTAEMGIDHTAAPSTGKRVPERDSDPTTILSSRRKMLDSQYKISKRPVKNRKKEGSSKQSDKYICRLCNEPGSHQLTNSEGHSSNECPTADTDLSDEMDSSTGIIPVSPRYICGECKEAGAHHYKQCPKKAQRRANRSGRFAKRQASGGCQSPSPTDSPYYGYPNANIGADNTGWQQDEENMHPDRRARLGGHDQGEFGDQIEKAPSGRLDRIIAENRIERQRQEELHATALADNFWNNVMADVEFNPKNYEALSEESRTTAQKVMPAQNHSQNMTVPVPQLFKNSAGEAKKGPASIPPEKAALASVENMPLAEIFEVAISRAIKPMKKTNKGIQEPEIQPAITEKKVTGNPQYSPFVQNLFKNRANPYVYNPKSQRKTAADMFSEKDLEDLERLKITDSPNTPTPVVGAFPIRQAREDPMDTDEAGSKISPTWVPHAPSDASSRTLLASSPKAPSEEGEICDDMVTDEA
ncbi:hypothetical protein GQ53DRAFT_858651 [Thozetella sp. PMI_491]|nr:hypothetical protein GQ53DRAFT_858651 [Thozetella sp. PMI_491]